MDNKTAAPATGATLQNTHADNSTNQYHITSAKELDVIDAIAKQMTPYFFAADDLQRLNITGTDAIRDMTRQKNPLQRVCRLRKVNGMDCITTVSVPDARDGTYGNAPGYYMLDATQMQRWAAAISRKAGN
ncbi:MAG: hypothetical protein L3K52_08020 [Candidatus Thiothrix sulfatifontis]|nr:MAG: hypothetical protein L3K52_08020 [Candidatus Thiothrix sulfatifontis]